VFGGILKNTSENIF